MNTLLKVLSCLLLLFFPAACTSMVHINVKPRDAMIAVQGNKPEPIDSAKNVKRPLFLKTTVEISKNGYEKHILTIARDTPEEVDVILNRIIAFSSLPQDARITDGHGQTIGNTPCVVLLPDNHPPVTYHVTREGFVPYSVTVSPKDTSTNIFKELYSDCPGRFLYVINTTPSGFPYAKKNLVTIRDLTTEKIDEAQHVLTLPQNIYPETMSLMPDGNTIILTVFTPAQTESEQTRWFTSKLMAFDSSSGALTSMSNGTYFEHHGVKRGNTLFFISRKTGRTDLWQSDMLPIADDCKLHTTNRFIKSALDITADGSKLLLTTTPPDNQQQPKLSILDVAHSGQHSWTVLTDGENGVWAPDGSEIAFQNATPSRLFRINANGSHQTAVNHLPGSHMDKEPAFSPDGTKIAFASNRGNENPEDFDIWLFDLKNEAATKIAASPAIDDKPVFSQDGKCVFFRSNRNNVWGIWKVPVNTTPAATAPGKTSPEAPLVVE